MTKPIKSISELLDFITELCYTNIDSSICIPKGLIKDKVRDAFGEALTLDQQSRMLEIYRCIPVKSLEEMKIPNNLYCDLHLHMDIDELNDKEDLNTLLFSRIQHNIYDYYKSQPASAKGNYLMHYSRIFKKSMMSEYSPAKVKWFILISSLIGGLLIYLTRNNIEACYAIVCSLGTIIIFSGFYAVILSFREK